MDFFLNKWIGSVLTIRRNEERVKSWSDKRVVLNCRKQVTRMLKIKHVFPIPGIHQIAY